MDKAIRQNIDRRALLKGAAFSTAVAAIPATIATALGAAPALAEAPDPIFALIAECGRVRALLLASDARCRAIAAAWPTLCAAPDGATRRSKAFRTWEGAFGRDSERSGFSRAGEENEALSDKVVDLENALLLTPAVTLAGAFAKLKILRETDDFDPEIDIQDAFILCLFDDFERLLAGSAVQS